MSQKNHENNIDQTNSQEPTSYSLASLYPVDKNSAESFRNSLQRFDSNLSDVVKKVLDRDSTFKLIDSLTKDKADEKENGKAPKDQATGKEKGDAQQKDQRLGQNIGSVSDMSFRKASIKWIKRRWTRSSTRQTATIEL